MQENFSPEQIGYAVGVVIGVLIVLGIIAFSILAIIKAATSKTTGWIIAGCIGGAFLLLLLGIFGAGFIKGFSRAIRARQERNDSSNPPTGESQTITGRTAAYTIQVPAGWRVQRHEKDFDVLADYRSAYVGVIAEEASLGTPETISKAARRRVARVGQNVQMTDPVPAVLDGRKWLTFSVSCNVEDIPFFYDYYVYAGPEGTFQIITWTFQNLAAKKTNQMNEVAQTFAFPK